MANFYRFSAKTGITAGVDLTVGAVSLSQRPLPPHLKCGEQFIGVDRHWSSAPSVLVNASLKTITTADKPFSVFVQRRSDDRSLYLFVDFGPMNSIQRELAAAIKARRGVVGHDTDDAIMWDKQGSGNVLLSLADQRHVDIWLPDGAIRRIVRQGDQLAEQALTLSGMTAMRVEQFRQALTACNWSDIMGTNTVTQGVHNAALRLLKHPRLDTESRDLLAQFLADQVGQKLHPKVRDQVREELLRHDHVLAGSFLAGYSASNVVTFVPKKNNGARAEAERKRGERIARDRKERAAMKGASNGQTTKQGGKKGK